MVKVLELVGCVGASELRLPGAFLLFLVFGLRVEGQSWTEHNPRERENGLLIELNNEKWKSELDVNFHYFTSEDIQLQKDCALLRTDMPLP